jgi:RimJ/RimL family protein N-acetyltransferase
MFERYAGDPEVTRYMSWPRHADVSATRAYIAASDEEWGRTGCGPFLVLEPARGSLVMGATGLHLRERGLAETGYVLAQDAWGRGLATEAVRAMLEVARAIEIGRVEACCHVDHVRSARVLEKCGFMRQARLHGEGSFPNLCPQACDLYHYAILLA